MSHQRKERHTRYWKATCIASATLVLAGGIAAPTAIAAAPSAARLAHPSADHAGPGHGVIEPRDWASNAVTRATLHALSRQQLARPAGVARTRSVVADADNLNDPIDARVLVMATTGDPNPNGVNTAPDIHSWDWNLSTLTNALDYAGVPYDVYRSTTRQLCVNGSWKVDFSTGDSNTATCTSGKAVPWDDGVTADRLWDGAAHAYYQGVMLTNGTLGYRASDGSFVSSALSSDEWTELWTFEAQFGIRMVSANTFPTADYGFTRVVPPGGEAIVSSRGESLDATWTGAGAAAFPYVNASGTLPITDAWVYRGAVDPTDATTDVLLTDPAGNALAVTHSYPAQGDREVLALTFDSARYLTHGQVIGYGLVDWVTKGLHLGFRKAMLAPQPDDVFIEDSLWSAPGQDPNAPDEQTPSCGTNVEDPTLPSYRMTGADLTALIAWQNGVQRTATGASVMLELPFVGVGATRGYTDAPDTLTPVARANQSKFKWVNHTWDHTNLDAISYRDAMLIIQKNNLAALALRLRNYSMRNLVQPDISGLTNPDFLRAAANGGVKYLISDTSRTGNPGVNGPNEGTYNAIRPSLFEIARYPVSLYFNVHNPVEWLAEDNCLYPAGSPYGHVDTYAGLLERETKNLLGYLLTGDNRPLMFHQPNLAAYDGTHSLLGDLLDATLAKYNALVTMPITSPTMNEIGDLQVDRTAYNAAWKSGALAASIVPGVSITITAQKAVTVPLTGVPGGRAYHTETYAGQQVSYVKLRAGQSVTLPLS